MDRIIVTPGTTAHPQGRRYSLDISCGDEGEVQRTEVFFDISGDSIPPGVANEDYAVMATLFFAMGRGADLEIRGRVTKRLLANLEEFQEAWCSWCPRKYKKISVSATTILPHQERAESGYRAVVAFSGGVDATFTLLRHHHRLAGQRSCDLVAAVLIHGFDIPLADNASFETAAGNARDMLRPLNLPLTRIRTNWREICSDWEKEYVTGLASCLWLFSSVSDVGLFGSDEDYTSFVLPWGSNPITNPMLASDGFRIVTDGGGFSRTGKVDLIRNHPEVTRYLRTCWEGPQTGGNCGYCEKCVRTKLNFLALGSEPPPSLPGRVGWKNLLHLRARNKVQLSFLVDILDFARKYGKSLIPVWKLALIVHVNRVLLAYRSLVSLLRS
jgi:hypothetical protein